MARSRSLLALVPIACAAWIVLNVYAASAYLFRAKPLTDEGPLPNLRLAFQRSFGGRLPVRETGLTDFNWAVVDTFGSTQAEPKAYAAAFQEAKRSGVAIVFLPGIPGSQLIRRRQPTDQVIWDARRGGEDSTELWGGGRVSADDLALPESFIGEEGADPSVYTKLLSAYDVPAAKDPDIYAEIDKRLTEIVANYGKKVVFSYDWRLDVRHNAQLLDKCIRAGQDGNRLDDSRCADLAGRDVIVVGHSLGGLIAWYWQQKYGQDPGPVRHVVLLGAPLMGSCEMFRALLHGYELTGDSSAIKKLGARILLGERLRAAIFTFPGALEVLPLVPQRAEDACIEEPIGLKETIPSNYFELDWWAKGVGSYLMGTPWEHLNALGGDERARRDGFFAWFGKALAVARDFRSHALDLSSRNVPITYFYSRDFGAPGKAIAGKDKKKRYTAKFAVTPAGDGRVTRATVQELERLITQAPKYPGQKFFEECHERHGRLPEDERFTVWLSNKLGELSQVAQARFLAKLLTRDERLRRAYMRRGPLIPRDLDMIRGANAVPPEVRLLRASLSNQGGT